MSDAPITNSVAETRTAADGPALHVPAVETEHLSRAVGGTVLPDAISVQVQTGEVLAVVERLSLSRNRSR